MEIIGILWGDKTVAWFDPWSVEHFLTGLAIGGLALAARARLFRDWFGMKASVIRYFDVVGVAFLGYLWEMMEHYLEEGLLGLKTEQWFRWVEFWGNRVIADPLLLIIGYLIVRRYPMLAWPARICLLGWFVVHVFVVPRFTA